MSLMLFAAGILSIFLLGYFRFFQESANIDKRLQHQQIARQAAISINEEALIRLKREAFSPESRIAALLFNAVSGTECDIQLPFSSKYAGQLIPQGYSCEYESKVKVIGFTRLSPDGKPYASKKEGHGIAAITSTVVLRKDREEKSSVLASYKLETHLDYLVLSVFPGTSEHPAFDKALSVRNTGGKPRIIPFVTNRLQLSFNDLQNNSNVIENWGDSSLPYQEHSLWTAKNLDPAALNNAGFIDHEKRHINLRGIVHCQEDIKLHGNWEMRGRGVLIADSFEISGAVIKAESKDFAIFYARHGNIVINTDLQIHAGLIAMNDKRSGTVLPGKNADIHGFIMVDRISPDILAEKSLDLTQNPIFGDKSYDHQIIVGDWINFISQTRQADAHSN